MIRRIRLAPIVLTLGLISGSAHAALQGRDLNGGVGGFEAYYDTDRNLTWLADANYARTSGYDTNGRMTWDEANAWTSGLVYGGYDDWRLPSSNTCSGYNCTSSEMGHLFYSELGGTAGYSILTSSNSDLAKFSNLQARKYWSGTEYTIFTGYAWYFSFSSGYQDVGQKDNDFYALAVRTGDVAAVPPPVVVPSPVVVPVPAAAWLLGSGLLGLIGVARRGNLRV